jgi:hypothetical protein
MYVSSLLNSNLFAFLSSCIRLLDMCSCFFLSSYMCRVQTESPIRVSKADMFATPSMTFKLPSNAAELAHLLAEAPSPPLPCTGIFNKLVLNFLHIEANQDKDSDRYDSPSCWLRLVCLKPPSHMYCFC